MYNKRARKSVTVQGVTYRTLFEARWAVYLEDVGWEVQYHPTIKGGVVHLPTFQVGKSGLPICYLYICDTRNSLELLSFSGVQLAANTGMAVMYGIGLPNAATISAGLPGYLPGDDLFHEVLMPLSYWRQINYGLCNGVVSHGIDPRTKAACDAARNFDGT